MWAPENEFERNGSEMKKITQYAKANGNIGCPGISQQHKGRIETRRGDGEDCPKKPVRSSSIIMVPLTAHGLPKSFRNFA